MGRNSTSTLAKGGYSKRYKPPAVCRRPNPPRWTPAGAMAARRALELASCQPPAQFLRRAAVDHALRSKWRACIRKVPVEEYDRAMARRIVFSHLDEMAAKPEAAEASIQRMLRALRARTAAMRCVHVLPELPRCERLCASLRELQVAGKQRSGDRCQDTSKSSKLLARLSEWGLRPGTAGVLVPERARSRAKHERRGSLTFPGMRASVMRWCTRWCSRRSRRRTITLICARGGGGRRGRSRRPRRSAVEYHRKVLVWGGAPVQPQAPRSGTWQIGVCASDGSRHAARGASHASSIARGRRGCPTVRLSSARQPSVALGSPRQPSAGARQRSAALNRRLVALSSALQHLAALGRRPAALGSARQPPAALNRRSVAPGSARQHLAALGRRPASLGSARHRSAALNRRSAALSSARQPSVALGSGRQPSAALGSARQPSTGAR